jgi:hypothetical protein
LVLAGFDPGAVAQVAASVEATARCRFLRSASSPTSATKRGRARLPISSTCTSAWTANGASGARRWSGERELEPANYKRYRNV